MRYLFVVGCSRTGTTGMGDLLNNDRRIVMGLERFKNVGRELTKAHFSREHFFNVTERETNVTRPGYYEPLMERWDSGTVECVGDKSPAFFRIMPRLVREFPGCKIVFMYRHLHPVASSFNVKAYNPKSRWPETGDYRKAVEQWNESLRCLRDFLSKHSSADVFVVKYTDFYCGNVAYLEALYDYIEMPLTDEMRHAFQEACKGWDQRNQKLLQLSEEMVMHLDKHKDRELEAWIESRLPSITPAPQTG